ncbi:MAG: hypothetical protein ABI040_05025 [Rhodoferax sp.]
MNLELRYLEGLHDAALARALLVWACAVGRDIVNFDSKGKP